MLKTISSVQHPLVKHFVRVRQNSDYRYEHNSIVVEGCKPIQEISRHLTPKVVMGYSETFIPPSLKASQTLIVNEAIMKKISGMRSPEGLIAEFPMPPFAKFTATRRLLALDGVSDPGNMGALLRSALALGWDGAFILENSCDPFNEKAVRAARGATFRFPMQIGSWHDLANLVAKYKPTVLLADAKGEDCRLINPTQHILLVVGNEAHGVSKPPFQDFQTVAVQMTGSMESLNVAVAGGILMFTLGQGHQ